MSISALVRRALEFRRGELRGLGLLLILCLLVRIIVLGFLDWRQRAMDQQLADYLIASEALLKQAAAAKDSLADTVDSGKLISTDAPEVAVGKLPAKPPDKVVFRHRPVQPIEINQADAAAFATLPGIGPVLSRRAVKFRDALGGFLSVDQFADLYGLSDSVFANIRPYLRCTEVSAVKKLDINTCTLDELRAHPFVAPWVAEAIITFRTQSGPIYDLSELKSVRQVTDSLYAKLVPYLVVH